MENHEEDKESLTWIIIAGAIYVGLLLYFGWQTWEFVDWLFPAEQLAMKCLTLLSFDIMAFLWACIDLFDRRKGDKASTLVRWAWGVSFVFSLLASILYLVIANMLRFDVTVSPETVDAGEAITIFALTLNILFLTFWLYGKLEARKKKVRPSSSAMVATPSRPAPVSTPVPAPAPKQSLPVYTTPKQNPEFFEKEFHKMQEELAELKKQRQHEPPVQPETNVSQPAPKRPYPILPDAPRYVDTEPLTPSAQPSYADDLAESVGGAAASPLSQSAHSQNGHQ